MPLGRGLYLEYIRRPYTGDLNAYLVFRDGGGGTRVIAGAPESFTGDESGGLEIDQPVQESRAAYGPAHSSRTRQSTALPTGEQTPEAAWEALTEAAKDLRRRGLSEDVMADNRRANRITRSLMDAAGIPWGRVVGANKLYHLPGFDGEGLKIEAKGRGHSLRSRTASPGTELTEGLSAPRRSQTEGEGQPSARKRGPLSGRSLALTLKRAAGAPASVVAQSVMKSGDPDDWLENDEFWEIEATDRSRNAVRWDPKKKSFRFHPTKPHLDRIEGRFHELVQHFEKKGWHTAAEYLDNFLSDSPQPKILSREEARGIAPIRAAEKENLRRFEEDTFRDEVQTPKDLTNIKEGETKVFVDHWDLEYGLRENLVHGLKGENDFVLAFGRFELKSVGYLFATRKANRLEIEGMITHSFDEPFDFNIDSEERPLARLLEEGQLLERYGRGKSFPVKGKWYQKVSGSVEIRNGDLVNPRMQVTDIDR